MSRAPSLAESRNHSGSRSGSSERLRQKNNRTRNNASLEETSSAQNAQKSESLRVTSHEAAESNNTLQTFDPVIKQGNPDEMDDDQINLDAIKKTLLSGGEEDLLLALFETQQILRECHEVAVQVLVPIICERVLDWTYNIKLSAAEALMAAVNSGIPTALAKDISATAFKIINLPFDQSMCEFWGDLLVATLPGVTWSSKKLDEVMDLLEMKYAASGDASSRQLAARILGSLATCSTDIDLRRRIMSRAIVITDDKDPQVRGMVAESLSSIGASVLISDVETNIWPCLLKLLQDEDARIHAVAIQSLSVISAAHREKHKKSNLFSKLLPQVLLTECTTIRRDARQDLRSIDDDLYLLLEINSRVFGELLYSCFDHIRDDVVRKEFFKAFLAMGTCNAPVIRKHCAYNMPAVALCLQKSYGARLATVVEYLSSDTDVETRWMLAAGIHETSRILAGSLTKDTLFNSVLVLLKDPDYLVRNAVLEHFEELITGLAKVFGYKSAQKLTPLFKNLQLLAKGQWRTQELLAMQLQRAAPLVPPPSLKMDVLPMLSQMAEGGAYQVRKAAMAAIAICIRYIPDVTERDKVMKSFNIEWAHGPVYWMRVAFIDCATTAAEEYSNCLFRDTFASELLRLARDPVANVRMRTALLLPKVAPACYELQEFQPAVEGLKNDKDKDVYEAVKRIDERIQMSLDNGKNMFENDMKLEDEEQQMFSRHLVAQREAQRTKNAMKRRPGAIWGKAAKGLQVSSARGSSPMMLDNADILHIDAKRSMDENTTMPKKSASSGPLNYNGSKEKKGKASKLVLSRTSPKTSDMRNSLTGTSSSPTASMRAILGFRNLKSPKVSTGENGRNKGIKKTLT